MHKAQTKSTYTSPCLLRTQVRQELDFTFTDTRQPTNGFRQFKSPQAGPVSTIERKLLTLVHLELQLQLHLDKEQRGMEHNLLGLAGLQLHLHLDTEHRGRETRQKESTVEQNLLGLACLQLQLHIDKDLREAGKQGRKVWEGSTHANGLSRSPAFNGSSAQLQGFV